MANDPIENILQATEALIESMTVANNYNYDWGTATVWDETKQTDPACYVDFHEEYEAQSQADSCSYLNKFVLEITLFPKLATESDTPRKSVRPIALKMLTDIKRLMNLNNTLNDTCDHVKYKNSKKVLPKNNDYVQAYQIKTYWVVQYQQLRNTPMTRS